MKIAYKQNGHIRYLLLALLTLIALPALADNKANQIVASAKKQIGVTISYDPSYKKIPYPAGDVPLITGVCTDVVIRALREVDIDLQRLVHEDMRNNFDKYPKNWGLKKPDSNIDHRRVPNLMRYLKRKNHSLPLSKDARNYLPGDIVAWRLYGETLHIGIVSDEKTLLGKRPKVIHNIGSGAVLEDILFSYEIIGHYRIWKT